MDMDTRKNVDISNLCVWKIVGNFISNPTNPNTNHIIIRESTNTWFLRDPTYKYKHKYKDSQSGKHKYDNYWIFRV